MRLLGLSVLVLPLSCVIAISPSLECADSAKKEKDKCKEPAAPVTTVAPGLSYLAKLPCAECQSLRDITAKTSERDSGVVFGYDLFLNMSLSQSNRTLYLNNEPIFPSLVTNPYPPRIVTPLISPNYTRAELDDTIACSWKSCFGKSRACGCLPLDVPRVTLDFDHYSHWLESHPKTQTEKWEVTFDAIGGRDEQQQRWHFNNSEQKMLRIILQGREIEGERFAGDNDLQAASSLFGTLEESEIVYTYQITSVEFINRSYTFPPVRGLGFWGRIRRFLGWDIVRDDGHVIYLQEEWGSHGKKGTLRQYLGVFIHDWRWDLVFITIGSVLGGLLVAWLLVKLTTELKQQRSLARWDGMDAVWARMRNHTGDEEVHQLLDESYRDEPDEDNPPRYTDEVQTNKPLPSKPLPEKPLPAVPLIDATR